MGLTYSTTAKNAMLDNLRTLMTHAALHSAFPGDTGASELSGGSPAYARKAVTWGAAAGGSTDMVETPTFDVPATTVRFVGFWSALTAGTFYAWAPLQGAAQATPKPFYTAAADDMIKADAHGFVDGDTVIVIDSGGAVLPAGLTEGTTYFVRDMVGDTFKLAATSGGAAIDLTADGGGFVQKIVPETFAAQGTYQLTDADLDLNV